MKILFLDDCLRGDKGIFGHGGFCIDEEDVNRLCDELIELKKRFGIPYQIEVKWSPDRDHFLRTTFEGERQQLYAEMLRLLSTYNVSIISAIHDLNDCYGIKNYGWDINRAVLWATKQQLKFIAERFEEPYLGLNDDHGIIIADKYSQHKTDVSILRDTYDVMTFGTEYRRFNRICMNPLLAISDFCPPLQFSDCIAGIIVGALSDSRYALDRFSDLATMFLKNPFKGSVSFTSTFSHAVLGYGMVLFPRSFRAKEPQLFRRLDEKLIYTERGIKDKSTK